MKLHHLFWLLVIALPAAVQGRAFQRVEQQRFTLPTDGAVRVNTYRGLINVVAGEGKEVKVTVHALSTEDEEAEARAALDALVLSIHQEGREIVVTATNPRETGVRLDIFALKKLELQFDFVVPAQCNLSLATADGSISVDSLAGDMQARAETGTISSVGSPAISRPARARVTSLFSVAAARSTCARSRAASRSAPWAVAPCWKPSAATSRS